MGRRKLLAMMLGGAWVAMVASNANAQMDQEQIFDKASSCIESSMKYNFLGISPEQIRSNCTRSAFMESFVDYCMALDTSWLKLGRHGYCVDQARKQFGVDR